MMRQSKACVTQTILTGNIAIKRYYNKKTFFLLYFFMYEMKIFFGEQHFCTNVYVLKRFLNVTTIFWQKNLFSVTSFYWNNASQNVVCDEGLK